MRHGGLVLAVLTAWGFAAHAAVSDASPSPAWTPSSERARQIFERSGQTISLAEAHEVQALVRTDPDRDVRLAAAWMLGRSTVEGGFPPIHYDLAPRRDRTPKPRYPDDAFRKGIEGVVTVDFLIDETGSVVYAEVRKSIPALDAAALATTRLWTFHPARFEGRPVPVLAQAPVRFVIEPPPGVSVPR